LTWNQALRRPLTYCRDVNSKPKHHLFPPPLPHGRHQHSRSLMLLLHTAIINKDDHTWGLIWRPRSALGYTGTAAIRACARKERRTLAERQRRSTRTCEGPTRNCIRMSTECPRTAWSRGTRHHGRGTRLAPRRSCTVAPLQWRHPATDHTEDVLLESSTPATNYDNHRYNILIL